MKRTGENEAYVDLEQVRGRRKGWGCRLGGEVELGVIRVTVKADVFVENRVIGECYR